MDLRYRISDLNLYKTFLTALLKCFVGDAEGACAYGTSLGVLLRGQLSQVLTHHHFQLAVVTKPPPLIDLPVPGVL